MYVVFTFQFCIGKLFLYTYRLDFPVSTVIKSHFLLMLFAHRTPIM